MDAGPTPPSPAFRRARAWGEAWAPPWTRSVWDRLRRPHSDATRRGPGPTHRVHETPSTGGVRVGEALARSRGPAMDRATWGWERRAVSQKRQKQEPVTETLMPPNPQSYPDSLFNVPVLHPPRSDVRSCAPRGERSNPWSRRPPPGRRFQARVLVPVPALLGRRRRHEEEARHPLPRCKIQSETVPSV